MRTVARFLLILIYFSAFSCRFLTSVCRKVCKTRQNIAIWGPKMHPKEGVGPYFVGKIRGCHIRNFGVFGDGAFFTMKIGKSQGAKNDAEKYYNSLINFNYFSEHVYFLTRKVHISNSESLDKVTSNTTKIGV